MPLCHMRVQREDGVCELGSRRLPSGYQCHDRGFPSTPRGLRSKCLLFIIHAVYDICDSSRNRLRHLVFRSCPCHVSENRLKTSEDHDNVPALN